jgi:hypothetical protein
MNCLFQINKELMDIRDITVSDNEWRVKKHGFLRLKS